MAKLSHNTSLSTSVPPTIEFLPSSLTMPSTLEVDFLLQVSRMRRRIQRELLLQIDDERRRHLTETRAPVLTPTSGDQVKAIRILKYDIRAPDSSLQLSHCSRGIYGAILEEEKDYSDSETSSIIDSKSSFDSE
jgi:hypothetical protein